MFQSALPPLKRSKRDPLRPLLSDEQWLEYALLRSSEQEWDRFVSYVNAANPIDKAIANTEYKAINDLDRELFEKYGGGGTETVKEMVWPPRMSTPSV